MVHYPLSKVFREHPEITCYIFEGQQEIYRSGYKGVRPLIEYYKQFGKSEKPLTVIDRIMGRGAVLLAIKIGATMIKTPIISESALELAGKYHLVVEIDKVVPYIINRNKDGRCPIESSLLGIDDIDEGYDVILETIAELMKG